MTTLTRPERIEDPAKAPVQAAAPPKGMGRQTWDLIVSSAGAVLAVILLVLGASAVYGGNFGQDNVQDRLAPQNITFPPADAMTPEEIALRSEASPAQRSTRAARRKPSLATSACTSPR